MKTEEFNAEAQHSFLPVAIMEHHQMLCPTLSQHDICKRLGKLWLKVQEDARANLFTLDADCILALNSQIAEALDGEPGDFLNRDNWLSFRKVLDEINGLEEDDGHVYSWIFSELYWRHLTRYRFSTSWMLVNALHLQRGHELNQLSLQNLGSLLSALSGSGPPTSDGQHFYVDQYS